MLVAHLLLPALLAAGAAAPADAAADYDEALLRELAPSPAVQAEARAASDAYRAQRWQEAIERYDRVLAAAPTFSHALRRQCNARLALGDRDAAVALCRRAHALARIPENEASLALALATRSGGREPSLAERQQAARLARGVLAVQPGDVENTVTVCEVSIGLGDDDLLGACSAHLRVLAPDRLETHYFGFASAFTRRSYREARAHLDRARALGLPAAEADRLGQLLDRAEPWYERWGWPAALIVAVAWAAGFLLLLGLGALLSRVTLSAAARIARAPAAAPAGTSSWLRRVYGAVIGLCCAYYYLSVPLVLLAVVGLGGGALYLVLSLGRVPVKLILVIGLVVIVSVWAVLKALWASVFRRDGGDPGLRLAPGDHPRLDAVLAQVAGRIGTRPVDAVFLTPGTEVAVFERGSVLAQVSGRSERCLILGVGVLDGMTRGALQAVLAHEYGHLVNRDTAGGGLALAVRRSVRAMGVALAEGGAAAWYNPAWLFVNGFHRVFLRVSQGASRLQEILADRWAALAYGGENFGRGLRHVIERSIRFDRHASAALQEVVEGERALANLYRYQPAAAVDEAAVASALGEALNAAPSPYDSHPRPADRIAWVSGIAGDAAGPEDGAPAWALFEDREAVERLMTAEVRANVARNNGVTIPAEPPAAPPPEATTPAA